MFLGSPGESLLSVIRSFCTTRDCFQTNPNSVIIVLYTFCDDYTKLFVYLSADTIETSVTITICVSTFGIVATQRALDTILELQDLMLFEVTLLPDDLAVVARSWVARFVVLLDVFVSTSL